MSGALLCSCRKCKLAFSRYISTNNSEQCSSEQPFPSMPFPPEGMCSASAKKILCRNSISYSRVTGSGTNLKYPRRLYRRINPEKEKSLRC
ncbi:hypothetical protein NC651_022009 [Populus alba x Populus x berolinensis]|nr:hypothetical protein NC651_022009 [Populus alba x Populus x berolinensis]